MELLFKNFLHLNNDEHQKLLNIRNSNHVRKQMKNDRLILLEEHTQWVKNLKNDDKNFYYACFMDKKIIGCVDITNIRKFTTSWGFYFEKNTSPLATSLCIYVLLKRIFDFLNMKKITSEVRKTNLHAYNFNLSCGFLHVKKNEEYIFLVLTKNNWQKSSLHKLETRLAKIDYKFI